MQSKWLRGALHGLAIVTLVGCTGTEAIGGGDASGGSGGSGTGGGGGTGGLGISAGTGGNSTDGPSESGGSETTPAELTGNDCTTELVATDATSYGVKGEGSFEIQYLKPGSELSFDWSGLAHNLAGDPLDAEADIDDLVVGLAHLSLSELIQRFTDGNVTQSDLDVVWELRTEEARTTASAFELNPVGGSTMLSHAALLAYFDVNEYPPATHTYFAMASHGTDVGFGVQAYTLFYLDPTATETTVSIVDPTMSLAVYTSPPDSPRPMVPVGVAGIDVDFGQLTHDTRGRAITGQDITKVELIVTSTPLAGVNLNALLAASRDHVWHRSLSNETSVNLSTLTDDDGVPFGGFERGYGWLLELHDGGLVPSLAYLVVLSPGCEP